MFWIGFLVGMLVGFIVYLVISTFAVLLKYYIETKDLEDE